MAAIDNSTTFGATVVSTPRTSSNGFQTRTLDSPAFTPSASREDLANPDTPERRHVPPHTPFYNQHLQLAPLEPALSRQTTHTDRTANEKDVEAGPTSPLAPQDDNNPFTSKVSVDCHKECRMWPSKQTLMEHKMAEKKQERNRKLCGVGGTVADFWGRRSKKQKLTIKIAFALLLCGIVVVIGVCISIAVNGTVYVSDNSSKEIPQ